MKDQLPLREALVLSLAIAEGRACPVDGGQCACQPGRCVLKRKGGETALRAD